MYAVVIHTHGYIYMFFGSAMREPKKIYIYLCVRIEYTSTCIYVHMCSGLICKRQGEGCTYGNHNSNDAACRKIQYTCVASRVCDLDRLSREQVSSEVSLRQQGRIQRVPL